MGPLVDGILMLAGVIIATGEHITKEIKRKTINNEIFIAAFLFFLGGFFLANAEEMIRGGVAGRICLCSYE